MTKKRIAFYIESMVVGGAEKVLIDYVNNLDSKLYDVYVIALFKKSVYNNYVFQFKDGFNSNVNYRYLIDNSSAFKYRIFNIIYNRLSHRQIYKWLVREKFDIEIAFYEGWPTEFVSHSESIKFAWLHTHQKRLYQDLSSAKVKQYEKMYSAYNQIISVSDDVGLSFTEIFPDLLPTTIYNPFDLKLIQKRAIQTIVYKPLKLGINFLTVGRLIEVKGYRRLIRVLSKIKHSGFQFTLTMIGDGEQREELQRLVVELKLQDDVKLLGQIENPYPYMRAADCIICSSFAEGLNTVVIEGVICGTPFLATDCAGMWEIAEHTKAGIICENSEDGLQNGLLTFIANKTLRDRVNQITEMASVPFCSSQIASKFNELISQYFK